MSKTNSIPQALLNKGLSIEVVEALSQLKNEPGWMTEIRLKAFKEFERRPMPTWGANIDLDFNDLLYFKRAADQKSRTWDDVPEEIKNTFDRLGIPEAEKKFLAGVATQYESEVIYENLKQQFTDQGVVFLDTDTGLKEYPELFKQWFGKIIPYTDNKLAALNTAVWSGGSFIYIPKGVKVEIPLQTYFFIQAKDMGQFERTMIVADEGSEIQYIEGCTAPMYTSDSLHAAVVELVAMKNSRT